MEKLANAERNRAQDAGVPEGKAVETPEDVKDLIDPVTGEAAQSGSADESGEDVDSIVQAAKAMRDGAEPAQARQAEQKTCLIVDDSRVIRKVSSKIAKSLGYVPVEAQDGTEALARCKKSMPHLVLTDWDMPEMDGIEFVKQLRAIPTPNAPVVVFCTSKTKAADVHAGIKAGADDYITKPFDEAGLRAKLERLGRGES